MERFSGLCRRMIMILAATTLSAALATVVVPNANADPSVVSLLLKPGEVGGIAPGKAQVFRTAFAVREASGERPSRSEVERYEAEGFVEAAIVRLHDRAERAARGLSSVFEFETQAGAEEELKAEEGELKEALDPAGLPAAERKYFRLKKFSVPTVPTAFGLAVLTNSAAERVGQSSGIAEGLFVQGSCLFSVGIFSLTSIEVIEPVRSGVQVISKRTDGACP